MNKLFRLARLQDCMSPMSWLCLSWAVFASMIVVFRPSFTEFIVLVIVDSIVNFINAPIDLKVFPRLFPDTSPYLKGMNLEQLGSYNHRQRVELLNSFVRYPGRRARYCYFWGLLKVVPAGLVVVFYWEHSSSYLEQFVASCALEMIAFTYFYGAVFIESHLYFSRLISDIHQKYDWTEAFAEVTFPSPRKLYEYHDIICIIFIIVFMMALQSWILFTGHSDESHLSLSIKILTVGASAVVFLFRIWQLNREYFLGGLQQIFDSMGGGTGEVLNRTIPIHSHPKLAGFERTFNQLTLRLKKSETELKQMILEDAEKNRFKLLGELSGLIAHDLSGPLHLIDFCVSEIDEDPQLAKDPLYIKHLKANVFRALDLIESLRARLKNDVQSGQRVSFHEVHRQVVTLLEIQYRSRGIAKVTIELDGELEKFNLKIPRVDLIQVIDNIYRNSIENLLRSQHESPQIRVHKGPVTEKELTILVEDNGDGMSTQTFENVVVSGRGLGLRLTKRLVEMNNGRLENLTSIERAGTTIGITLPYDGSSYRTDLKHAEQE